jgi:hypothetical protein
VFAVFAVLNQVLRLIRAAVRAAFLSLHTKSVPLIANALFQFGMMINLAPLSHPFRYFQELSMTNLITNFPQNLPTTLGKKTVGVASIFILKLCFTAAVFSFASAKAMAASEPEFQAALQQLTSPSGSKELAAESFSALLKKEPGNPLLMAYAGSATSSLATTTSLPWKKMSYAEEGMAMLDKALQLVAASDGSAMHGATAVVLEVKFTASSTFLAVPGFMNRGPRGEKLLTEVLTHTQFEQAALGFRGAVWMRAARLALEQKRGDDAKRFLNEVIQNAAPQADAAKALLKGVA